MIYAIALSLSLMGCSFGKDSSGNTNKRELEEQQKADADYSLVVGTYAGQINLGYAKHEIQLKVFTLAVPDGTNSDGRTKFRTELRANYIKINPVSPGYTFMAQFYPETGRMVLTNTAKEETLGEDDLHTVELKVVRGTATSGYLRQLQGEGKGTQGVLGHFENLNLVTGEAQKPDGSREEEYNNRLREQYKQIEGIYYGLVKQDPRLGPPTAVTLRLYIYNDGSNSKRPPVLKGLFTQDDGGDIQFDCVTNYKPDLKELSITGTVLRAPNSNLRLNLDGKFKFPAASPKKEAMKLVGHAQYSSLSLDGDFVLTREE